MSPASEARKNAVLATSRAVARLPGLDMLLDAGVVYAGRKADAGGATAVVAWGNKPSAAKAAVLAARLCLPLLRLEDGFLRSVGLGRTEPPLSVVVDDLGIYYDAAGPSRIEAQIAAQHTEAQRSRGLRLAQSWREARVSKYNHAREFAGTEKAIRLRDYVLVADQTLGDASIRCGLANTTSFQRMLDAALAENPGCSVVLKVHPEVAAGRKKGHFDLKAVSRNQRVLVLGKDVHPVSLIERAGAVYVVTSQLGFEGLLWRKRVRTFGMPFYAGWGLTQDELPPPDRRQPAPLENLVHAALVEYPRYIDPETAARCEPERAIEWMALQRRMRGRFPARVYALGFSIWKKPIVRGFFQGSDVTFVSHIRGVPSGATLVVWGRKAVSGSTRQGVRTVRLEDGFLRSVGLGADLVQPLSWIADGCGMYYDSTAASDLEHLLQTARFDEAAVGRAKSLRERIVAQGLTKYNVGSAAWRRRGGGRVILVPGQVESDASIRFGAPEIRTNLGLLRAVREDNPGVRVIYKPHPDVVAGLRRAGCNEGEARFWCDEIVTDVVMGALLSAVDEVHVLTSLAGFEALLRGKRVVTYGQPFYAGWGLTHDVAPVARRTRKLSLDELVAGVLVAYPMYVSRVTRRFTSPERALDELSTWRDKGGCADRWWRKGARLALRFGERWR